jgi:hypothetical protein
MLMRDLTPPHPPRARLETGKSTKFVSLKRSQACIIRKARKYCQLNSYRTQSRNCFVFEAPRHPHHAPNVYSLFASILVVRYAPSREIPAQVDP